MPPMATEKSEGQGKVSDALCEYYDEKTKGGYFGLVVAEHSYISQEGQASKGQVSFSSDDDVPGLKRLVEVIHRNGCKVVAQINHAGGKSISALGGESLTAPAPSAMPYTTTRGEAVQAHAMTQREIDRVVADFASAARRAKEAGFDGIEIHSAHGYLLSQFYSPITNKRTDDYSGTSIAGRTRLHCRVIEAVRSEVGPDYLLALRLGACDYEEGGATREDAVAACKIFEEAGVDLLDISGGLCGYRGDGSKAEGYFGEDSAAIRAAVTVPVIVTGGVRTPEGAERVLEKGQADLVGVGRAVLKIPYGQKMLLSLRVVPALRERCSSISTGPFTTAWRSMVLHFAKHMLGWFLKATCRRKNLPMNGSAGGWAGLRKLCGPRLLPTFPKKYGGRQRKSWEMKWTVLPRKARLDCSQGYPKCLMSSAPTVTNLRLSATVAPAIARFIVRCFAWVPGLMPIIAPKILVKCQNGRYISV